MKYISYLWRCEKMEVISKKEYRKIHKDYKTIINGQHYILKATENGTCLVPVIVK